MLINKIYINHGIQDMIYNFVIIDTNLECMTRRKECKIMQKEIFIRLSKMLFSSFHFDILGKKAELIIRPVIYVPFTNLRDILTIVSGEEADSLCILIMRRVPQ